MNDTLILMRAVTDRPYGDPERPLTGTPIQSNNPDSSLVRHWAFKLRRTRDLDEVLKCIQLYAEAHPNT